METDRQSRLDHDNTEWQLNPLAFQELVQLWGNPGIDLFASRLNYQVKPYISWKRDPEAIAVDAFSIPWDTEFYAFPPFSLIGQVLAKIQGEGSVRTDSTILDHWGRKCKNTDSTILDHWGRKCKNTDSTILDHSAMVLKVGQNAY